MFYIVFAEDEGFIYFVLLPVVDKLFATKTSTVPLEVL